MKDVYGWEGRYAITKEGKVWSYWKNGWMPPGLFKDKEWYASISFLKQINGKRIRK